MPNATFAVYLTDEEYVKFVPKKEGIIKLVKKVVKKEVNGGT